MAGETSSLSVLADATSNRLRVLQSQLADDSAENRAAALYQEVREAVGKILPEQRRDFLAELQERFPVFSDGSPLDVASVATEAPDKRSALEMLEEQASSMSPIQKQQAAERLRQAGFPLAAPAELPSQEAQELCKLLQLPAGARPDAARSMQLLMVLAEFAAKLDQASWKSWAQIDPAGDIKSGGPLPRMMARFVRGDATRPQLLHESDRLLKLTASMIVAVQKIGPNLFKNWFDPIAPATIREETESGLLKKAEVQCWKKYEERAGAMDSGAFNTALFAAVARFVRDFFGPAPAQPPAAGADRV